MRRIYQMEELDCANCAREIEESVKKIAGVETVQVNFILKKMTIDIDEAQAEKVMKAVKKAVRRVEPSCRLQEAL